MLKSQDEEVLTLWSSMKTMRPIQKKKKMKRSSSLGKRVHQERRTIHSIKLGRKEIHQGEIRFWKSIKQCEKKNAIKLGKTSKKRRERNECKNFHQVVREYWFIKRHKRYEIPWKIIQVEKDEQTWRFIKRRNLIKLRKMRKRKSKIHFIKKKKRVFS